MKNERLNERRRQLTLHILRARINFAAFGLLTVVNILLCLIGIGFELPFYLSIPYYATVMAHSAFGDASKLGFVLSWLIVAGVSLGICGWFLLRSAKSNRAVKTLTVLTLIDLAANVGLLVLSFAVKDFAPMQVNQVLNLLFHIYVLYYVNKGRKAVNGLSILPTEEELEEDSSDPYAEFGGSGEDGE